MSFGFIIPVCCREDVHLRQLHRCIESIRKYYQEEKIILIENSREKYNIVEEFKEDHNIIVQESFNKGSEDQQIFKVFLETSLFEKAVFVQDSMLLNKKLDNIDEINDIKFIWHFTNHRVHWDKIREPISEYNRKNKIITHTDLIKHCLIKDYSDNQDFVNFSLNGLKNKHLWVGSFGSLCIITKNYLKILNKDINFVEKFVTYSTNRNRRVNESIFSLLCHYKFPNINFEDSYDGLYYDGKKHGGKSHLINKKTGFDNLVWCSVHEYFSKVSFNR